MDCERCRECMQDFVDGELVTAQRAEFIEHVESCDGCRRELKTLQVLAQRLERLPLDEPSASFEKRLATRLARETGGGGGILARLLGLRAAWIPAVGVVALVAVGLLWMPFGTGPDSGTAGRGSKLDVTLSTSAGTILVNGQSVAGRVDLYERDKIVAQAAAQAWLRWPDGTKVKVREGTRLQVFDRKLFLDIGGVLVEVEKGKGRFEVNTPFAVAAVKGTRFHVVCDGKATTVAVEEGLVAVRGGDGRVENGRIAFVPKPDEEDVPAGKKAIVNPAQEYITVQDFDDPSSLIWNVGDFTVDHRKKTK